MQRNSTAWRAGHQRLLEVAAGTISATSSWNLGLGRSFFKSSSAIKPSASLYPRLMASCRYWSASSRRLAATATQAKEYPGFGITSALHTLAELALLPADLDVRQWVAYAGMDPREYTSGTSVHKKARISKAGNHHLRRALYMPALVAVQHQANLRAFYEHLLARGKTKLQALVATMRKLLHAIYGMFKHNQLFNGSKVYELADAPLPQEVA